MVPTANAKANRSKNLIQKRLNKQARQRGGANLFKLARYDGADPAGTRIHPSPSVNRLKTKTRTFVHKSPAWRLAELDGVLDTTPCSVQEAN